MIKRRSLLRAAFLGAAVAFTQPRLALADGLGDEVDIDGLLSEFMREAISEDMLKSLRRAQEMVVSDYGTITIRRTRYSV